MRRIRPNAWIFACLSGVLQVLIFPNFSFYLLGWIALAPLIYAILKCREQDVMMVLADGGQFLAPATAWQGFLLGYVSGVIWYVGSCSWIFHAMHVYGGIGPAMSALLLVMFALYLGLYHGLFGLLLALIAARRNGYSLRALVFTPFAWVAVELARTYITGFPWDLLGTTQIDNIALSRIATVTGVYGISFEIVLVNTAVAAAFLVPYVRRKLLLTAALASAIALHAGKLHHPAAFATSDGATLVQADIPILDSGAWTLDYLTRTLDSLQALSVRPQHNKPDTPGLIVWPESPAPFFATDLHLRYKLAEIARNTDSYVIAGSMGIEHTGEVNRQPVIYNSASVVAPSGAWTARYDKIHLVPFGEFVPLEKLFSFAAGLTRQIGTFGRGRSRMPLDIGDARAGVFICYESIFPDEVRQFANNGAELLVNISNDGWYGEGGAQRQHLNMARMRAVENNRWLLRDTDNGITAVIDPYGRVVAEAPRNQRTQLQAAYSLEESMTFYTRHGDWFSFLCAIITVGGLVLRYFSPGGLMQTQEARSI
ncbi:MAG TPA: apolipoprotein N-acyltransferase [Terriglobales bacterium]|nr:apolipoprotein N-acyltransferase [Terriglobales bacterium]